jgi:hypothetical protein
VGLTPAALTRHLRALKQGGLKLWLGETERRDELAAFKAHVERSSP